MSALNRFQEWEGEGFQNWEHVRDLLGHTEHALGLQLRDESAFCDGGESSSMPVHLVFWDVPAGFFSVEVDA